MPVKWLLSLQTDTSIRILKAQKLKVPKSPIIYNIAAKMKKNKQVCAIQSVHQLCNSLSLWLREKAYRFLSVIRSSLSWRTMVKIKTLKIARCIGDRNGITLNIHRSHVNIRVGMHMCMEVHTYKVKNYRWGRVCLENWLWGILYILEEKSFYVGKLGHQSHLEAFALWSKQYNWLQQSGMLFILNMDSFHNPWYIEPFFLHISSIDMVLIQLHFEKGEMEIVCGSQTMLKQGEQQGTEVRRDRSSRLFTPLGLQLLQTWEPEYRASLILCVWIVNAFNLKHHLHAI